MQIVVQEGEASVSLTTTIQAPDDSLRTTSLNILTGAVKVYYRDFEIIRVEARDGALEITAAGHSVYDLASKRSPLPAEARRLVPVCAPAARFPST